MVVRWLTGTLAKSARPRSRLPWRVSEQASCKRHAEIDTTQFGPLYTSATKARTPEEIAAGILFLASDESRFATDTILTSHGGMTAQ